MLPRAEPNASGPATRLDGRPLRGGPPSRQALASDRRRGELRDRPCTGAKPTAAATAPIDVACADCPGRTRHRSLLDESPFTAAFRSRMAPGVRAMIDAHCACRERYPRFEGTWRGHRRDGAMG